MIRSKDLFNLLIEQNKLIEALSQRIEDIEAENRQANEQLEQLKSEVSLLSSIIESSFAEQETRIISLCNAVNDVANNSVDSQTKIVASVKKYIKNSSQEYKKSVESIVAGILAHNAELYKEVYNEDNE